MKAAVTAVIVALVLAIGVGSASADNYGGVSPATEAKMKGLIYAEFGRGWLGQTMVRCARRESHFNPRAANWTDSHGGSFGLIQANGVHAPGGYATKAWIQQMWNPVLNLRQAHKIYRAALRAYGNGLQPWGYRC